MAGIAGSNYKNAAQRGIATVLALIVVAVLFFAAIIVIQYGAFDASDAGGVSEKTSALAAAEAGVNDGIKTLDVARGATATGTTSGPITLATTGANYIWTMTLNNLPNPNPTTAPDGMVVPKNSAYITATGKNNSATNFRAAIVGAIVGRATGVSGPGGAIDAAQNIQDYSHAPVFQSATNVPADVHANGNIYTGGNPGTVQGTTYAAGSTNQWTTATNHYVAATPVPFPTNTQAQALASEALALAQSGTTVSGSSLSGSYSGDVYVNGNVSLSNTATAVTFNNGGTVYINGNVTISGKGTLTNAAGSFIVVNGTFSSQGQGGLKAPLGTGGELMVLAADPNPSSCVAGTGGCAVLIGGNGGSIGLVYAPYGSIQMAGNGTIIGALVAGVDIVFAGGGAGGAFQYDPVAGTNPITANNYKVLSYIEH